MVGTKNLWLPLVDKIRYIVMKCREKVLLLYKVLILHNINSYHQCFCAVNALSTCCSVVQP